MDLRLKFFSVNFHYLAGNMSFNECETCTIDLHDSLTFTGQFQKSKPINFQNNWKINSNEFPKIWSLKYAQQKEPNYVSRRKIPPLVRNPTALIFPSSILTYAQLPLGQSRVKYLFSETFKGANLGGNLHLMILGVRCITGTDLMGPLQHNR